MSTALDFQSIIFKLQTYWAGQGCLIWQPYSEKVGAGTANPGTILRVLGPEPWNVAYAEPSYRPDDGRYAVDLIDTWNMTIEPAEQVPPFVQHPTRHGDAVRGGVADAAFGVRLPGRPHLALRVRKLD